MSNITDDSLTRSGAGCFIAVYPYGNSGRQRVNSAMIAIQRMYNTAESILQSSD